MDRIDDQKDWGENIYNKKNAIYLICYVLFKFFFFKKKKKENCYYTKQNELWDRTKWINGNRWRNAFYCLCGSFIFVCFVCLIWTELGGSKTLLLMVFIVWILGWWLSNLFNWNLVLYKRQLNNSNHSSVVSRKRIKEKLKEHPQEPTDIYFKLC